MKEIRTLEHTYNMRSFLMLCTNCKAAGCLFSALPKWQHVWWCWSHLQLSQRSTVLLKVGFRAGVHACYSQWTAPQTDSKDTTLKITPTPHRLVPRDVGHRQCQPVFQHDLLQHWDPVLPAPPLPAAHKSGPQHHPHGFGIRAHASTYGS